MMGFYEACHFFEEKVFRGSLTEGGLKRLKLPPQLYIGKQPKASLVVPVVNGGPRGIKPDSGGLWTSHYNSGRRGSKWKDFSTWRPSSGGWVLHPRKAKIFVINSHDDLLELLDDYGRPSSLPPELAQALGETKLIDFEALSKDFDALHLTDEGQHKTRMTRPNLYGWDVESTLWFRWKFAANPSRVSFM